MEKKKYSNYGWLPANKLQPYNNHNVAVLVIRDGYEEDGYETHIGFYEDGEWHINDISFLDDNKNEYKVKYWFPIPCTW